MTSVNAQPEDRWRFDPCTRPVLMRRTSASVSSGEVVTAEFQVRCGTRRAEDCPACAKVWQNDAFHALLKGANRATELTFITFTAPGSAVFGAVHTAQFQGHASERCACRRYHRPADPRVGTPVDPASYKYEMVAAFNHAAPRLTAVTMQKVWRLRAAETGLNVKEARLPMARVMEWQRRGVLHVHLIVQGHVSEEAVQAAVRGRKAKDGRRTVLAASHSGFTWGHQVDVRHVKASDALQLAAYVTKVVGYAVKDVTAHLDDTGGSAGLWAHRRALHEAGEAAVACWRPSRATCRHGWTEKNILMHDKAIKLRVESKTQHLCRRHSRGQKQFGFTGNVLSMNRSWGATLAQARDVRKGWTSHNRAQAPADYVVLGWERLPHPAPAGCLEPVKKLVTQSAETVTSVAPTCRFAGSADGINRRPTAVRRT